ncbi:triosephosphate isomerase [Bartonella quintana]|uniref:Triosephosphate isomerase n=1 Tax=Bartonella quintana (strain Toulouse) TaxID=283165 RepID=TPIS_BARQU|nr:triose-phosphate isomerase [Bartonella quintana]Q6G029.1 RecName: Full=Triosephosphate isomerase; Short=TIM; Short=TPI; AltName: Full=Triose-phosphate isomerase [Bartonella quintana str. Toulouse]AFR26206.1 triosephosphate isomerase [Bartonella quintana RM-11]ETS18116.1 triosephosphate isomerase [Bartonella quintana JK 7]ETS18945.1 triosephosphate isomerase [Bartonella quintana JK 12]QUG71778.1 triose-phosphate isomerase [Bartonella quintana]CAF25983.1 Triose-phosphate isomerase [Bartonell
MSPNIRPFIAGNWKMNGTVESLGELRAIAAGVSSDLGHLFEALICVPATLLSRASDALSGENLLLGGQNCHFDDCGPYTGDISAFMLKEAGASHVIIGHSERRTVYQESDAIVCAKVQAAWRAGLVALICVGETLEERTSNKVFNVLTRQLEGSLPDGATAENVIIAYEPVWAIGTGNSPTSAVVAEVHDFIRHKMCSRFGDDGRKMRLLYGGSVKPSNAFELLSTVHVNGALIGGASLKAIDFLTICDVYRKL